MQIRLTDDAQRFLAELGQAELTVSSLMFTSCCSGPLPPEVKPGAPGDAEGFDRYQFETCTIFFDTLLDPRPSILIDLKEYPSYRELFVQGWE